MKRSRARKALNATPSALGDKIRGVAAGYDKAGQHAHAAGMRQAADIADKHGTGGLADRLDFALAKIDEAVRLLSGIRGKVAIDTDPGTAHPQALAHKPPEAPVVKVDVEGVARPRRSPKILEAPASAAQPDPSTMNVPALALLPCERAILTVLKARAKPTTRRQILILSRYRNSGSFAKALTTLKGSGYIYSPDTNVFTITPSGAGAIGHVPPLPTGPESVAYWAGELGPCAGGILKALVRSYPSPLTLDALVDSIYTLQGVRYSNPPSGSFSKALTLLRKLDLMDGTTRGDGSLRATSVLMNLED